MTNAQLKLLLKEYQVNNVTATDYARAEMCLTKFNVIMHAFYQRTIIIDLHKMNFMSVAPTPYSLCGHSHEEVRAMGMDFFLRRIVPSEWGMIIKKTNAMYSKMMETPIKERCECSCHFSVSLTEGKRNCLAGVTVIPFALTADGRPWLVLCVFFLSPGARIPQLYFKNNAVHKQMLYNFKRNEWMPTKGITLTEKEQWIIHYACQGLPNKVICNLLCMSMDGIKKCRRCLFKKLGVTSMPAAIACVIFYDLL